MADTVTILNSSDLAALGNITVTDVSINQKINDKYTLDFTAYQQPFIDLLASGVYINIFIKKENGQDVTDIFAINEIRHNPVEGRYQVSCEHVSYDLNKFTRTDETGIEEFTYTGTTSQIVTEILGLGSRFSFIPSDDIPETFEFTTTTIGRRSRIIEFCKQEGLEVFWRDFNVAIQRRRGIDDGLLIELGSNLRGLEISTVFNFDNTTTTIFDVDFIDLNAITDVNGQPLAPGSFDMGDYVTLRYKDDLYYQRVVAVTYNPFERALPNVELENPIPDILQVIAGDNSSNSKKKTDIDKYFSEFRIGDVNVLPLASDETEQVKKYVRGETGNVSASATYITSEKLMGLFAELKAEYENKFLTLLITYREGSGLVTEALPWTDISTSVANIELPTSNSDESYTLAITEMAFADLTQQNVNDALIKAYGVTLKEEKNPVPENEKIAYAFVGSNSTQIRGIECVTLVFIKNITNFKDNFADGNFSFERGDETTEFYPVDLTIFNSNTSLSSGVLVQVIDGVVSSVLSPTPGD